MKQLNISMPVVLRLVAVVSITSRLANLRDRLVLPTSELPRRPILILTAPLTGYTREIASFQMPSSTSLPGSISKS